MAKITLLLASILLAGALAHAQAHSPSASAPAPQPNASLPHDSHGGLVLSADAYTDVARAKEKFGKANPVPAGILPVEVFLRNETDQPIRIDLNTIQLDLHPPGARHENIGWLSSHEVANALAHPAGASTPKASRFPIGLPSSKDSKADKFVDILQPLTLDADIVPPMGMIHGFLYFDMDHDVSLAESSSLYVPDAATVPSNKTLMFFEVPLGRSSQR